MHKNYSILRLSESLHNRIGKDKILIIPILLSGFLYLCGLVQKDTQDLEDTYMLPSQCVILGSAKFRDFDFYYFHSEWTLKRVFDEWSDSVKLIPCPAIIIPAPKVVNGFSFR
jgi:hypothetical protein